MTTLDEVDDRLTEAEGEALIECESIIADGLLKFYAVGDALAQIRDERLYRIKIHGQRCRTFREYCEKRWQMGDRYARYFMEAASTYHVLESGTIVPPPTVESQARPMNGLEPEEKVAAWERATEKAAEEGSPVAARHVVAAVAEIKPNPAKRTFPAGALLCMRCQQQEQRPGSVHGLCYSCGMLPDSIPEPNDQRAAAGVNGFMAEPPEQVTTPPEVAQELRQSSALWVENSAEAQAILRDGQARAKLMLQQGQVPSIDSEELASAFDEWEGKNGSFKGERPVDPDEPVIETSAQDLSEVICMAIWNQIERQDESLCAELQQEWHLEDGGTGFEDDEPVGTEAYATIEFVLARLVGKLHGVTDMLTLSRAQLQEAVTLAEKRGFELAALKERPGLTIDGDNLLLVTEMAARMKPPVEPGEYLAMMVDQRAGVAGYSIIDGKVVRI